MILVTSRIEISKKEDRSLITKTRELSDKILSDFPLRLLELPVFEKLAHFRFQVGNGSRKYDVAPVHGETYSPSKFHANRSMGDRVISPGHIKKRHLSHDRAYFDHEIFINGNLGRHLKCHDM